MKGATRIVLATLAAFGLGLGSAVGQVLNLSHDLVRLGIASKNLAPNNPTLDAGPLIFAGVQYAYSNAIPLVTLDTGNYFLLSDQQPNATVIFGRMSNITLDLADSTIFFRGPYVASGIALWHCTNFALKNFKTDFLTPPYTHVQLTSVDPAARTISYATLPGWPDPTTFNGISSPFGGENDLWLAVFRNGQIVSGTTRSRVNRPIAGNTLTLNQDGTPWTQSPTLATLQPGDTVVVVARGGGAPIGIFEGDTITLSNVTVQGSAETAVQFYASKNSIADGVRVVPRPGTGLVGSNGDAIHFASARGNNHIVNSYATRTLDDGLVMDNQHAAIVLSQTPPRNLSVRRDQYLRFPNGTAVNFVDPSTTLESATGAVIVAQNPPDSLNPAFSDIVDLTFDRDLPSLPPGMAMVYADPSERGQGSTITDSVAEDIYAGRGIWIAGLRGLTIERNTVRRTSMAGIILSTSTDPFDTGDIGPPAHDVVIRDNVVEDALSPAAGGTGAQVGLGAIQVVSTDNQQFGFSPNAGNTNISILDNWMLGSGRSGIWVGETNGAVITGNVIAGYNAHPEASFWGIPAAFDSQARADSSVPLVVRYSSGVQTANNRVLTPPDFNADGRADVLWRESSSGYVGMWLMNGAVPTWTPIGGASPTWTIQGIGDFNRDGRADILWRDASGYVGIWAMSAGTYTWTPVGLADNGWAIQGVGDFDGDGKADILWRQIASGYVGLWLMNGGTYTWTPAGLVDTGWAIQGVGDFDGDGKSDILWRHFSGYVGYWKMNAGTYTFTPVGLADNDWAIQGVGDFDGDGISDILWRYTPTGYVGLWLMNGASATWAPVGGASTAWRIAGVGDYDRDGKSDILWRYPTTGDVGVWLMNGPNATWQSVGAASTAWTVQ